jgi:peptide alpha-N-acetyltransferase
LISLFTEIQAVYEAGKESLIEAVFLEYEASLAKEVYPDGTEIQSPSEYLWSLYLLAQHFGRRF